MYDLAVSLLALPVEVRWHAHSHTHHHLQALTHSEVRLDHIVRTLREESKSVNVSWWVGQSKRLTNM